MATPTLWLYLAQKFFVAVLAVFALCCLLIFMIDFIEMLRQSGKHGNIGLSRVLTLTLLRLPAYAELLITFAVLVATIATLLNLNRKSELSVMRAGGMSAWQFLRPGIFIAIGFGIFGVLVYNPLAASARAKAEELYAEYYGKESNFLKTAGSKSWLRQDSVDGASAIHGAAVTDSGMTLNTVTAFRFDKKGEFVERISGRRARLRDGFWRIEDAWVTRPGQPPEQFGTYLLATHLSPARVQDALGSVISLSFWQLPAMIELARKAGLSSASYEVQLHLLISRPFLLVAMVLLGATVSLGSFRSGGTQTMVLFGMGGGFAFFLTAELSRQVGLSGLVAPWVAVWVPVGLAWLLTSTILLWQEDG
jgi:lipopolysaccharide export system permease protein